MVESNKKVEQLDTQTYYSYSFARKVDVSAALIVGQYARSFHFETKMVTMDNWTVQVLTKKTHGNIVHKANCVYGYHSPHLGRLKDL